MTADGEAEASAEPGLGSSSGIGIPPIGEPIPEHGEPPRATSGRKHSFAATAFLLLQVVGVYVASLVVSVLALTVWKRLSGSSATGVQGIAELSSTLGGILVIVLPQQASMFLAVWLIARRSPEGAAERLGLSRGRAGPAAVVLGIAGTLGVQWAASAVVGLVFREPSGMMREMWKMLSTPTGSRAIAIGLLISAVPGVCEEVLFRGLLLRGLLRHRSGFASIAIAGSFFALAHGELQYALAVLPLGLWLGFLAWRTGSIRLSIACHTANNLAAIVFGRIFGDAESGDLPTTPWMLAAGILLCVCAAAAVRVLPSPPTSRGTLAPG
jgi:membrane protease YdiL (CAAX protease family)